MTEVECPKKYYGFDVSIVDCFNCHRGKLYRQCASCKENSSCDGWADDKGTYCCKCYKQKQGKK